VGSPLNLFWKKLCKRDAAFMSFRPVNIVKPLKETQKALTLTTAKDPRA